MGFESLALYDSEPRGSDAGARTSRVGAAPATRIDARYSRFVGTMKVLLPAIAVALMATVFAWPHLEPGKERFRLGFATVTPGDVENPRMVNARFQGTDGVNRPFTVTAKTVIQPAPGSTLIELERPQADLTLEDGAWVALSSLSGTYDQDTNDLELRNQVSLFHDAGYELHTASAHIDLGTGTAYGEAPVAGQGPAGLLNSEGFRVLDHGKTIVFTGRARLLVHPGATGPAR